MLKHKRKRRRDFLNSDNMDLSLLDFNAFLYLYNKLQVTRLITLTLALYNSQIINQL